MNVIVTGGAGFIGSHLCKKLLRLGHEVMCVDNLVSGKYENIVSERKHPRFEFVKLDIRQTDKLDSFFKWADIVFHQAASKKNICLQDPHADLEINGGGTLGLLQLAVKHGVKKFVHASTGSVYGEPTIFPSNEDHPLNPCSYYGVSKLAGEKYVQMFHKEFGLNTTILRYFHVYGPMQENDDDLGGVVSIFSKKMKNNQPLTIYGDGTQVRSFTHVKDVVDANICAIESEPGGVYNCASGTKTTILGLVSHMAKYYNVKPVIEYEDWMAGDVKQFDVDNSKIKKELRVTFSKKLDLTGI